MPDSLIPEPALAGTPHPAADEVVLGGRAPGRAFLLALNCGAVVVAALYFGRELLVPLVLAALLAFVLAPACAWLQRLRLPRVLAVLAVVLVAFAIIFGIGMVVARQVGQLADGLPAYQSQVLTKWDALAHGNPLTRLLGAPPAPGAHPVAAAGAAPEKPGEPLAALGLDGSSALTLARDLAAPILAPLATAGVVLVFTLFILLYNEDLRDRLVRLVGRTDLHRTILAMNEAAGRLSRFFLFQLMLNAGFGLFITGALFVAGLPNPVLWGILAALMRFVPFIGIFIAVVPPLLLALAVAPGWSLALLVLGMFVVGELLMGQVIEPLIYGHSTGLSPLAVIVATAFWALLWGPVGLLIATPLTVCLVVIGRHVEPLAFLDVMLGDSSPLEPHETFYQRALEGNAATLAEGARQRIAATSLTGYYDQVALRGLAVAQRDLSRDALAYERLDAIHAQIAALLALVGRQERGGAPAGPTVASEWADPGAVLCVPGRGQLDDLAASMAVQVLTGGGFGASLQPNNVLGATAPDVDFARVRLCCLSVLVEGSTVAGIRYFIRRMQKRMPNAAIVIGLWHAPGDDAVLAALRSEGETERVVLSLGELLALAQALSARGERRAA